MKQLLHFSIILLLSSSYAFGSQASANADLQPQAQSNASMAARSGLRVTIPISSEQPLIPELAADTKSAAESQPKKLTVDDLYGERFAEEVDMMAKFLLKDRTQHEIDDAALLGARASAVQCVLFKNQSLILASGFKSLGSKIDILKSEHSLLRYSIDNIKDTLRSRK